jgi:succinate-acetate transporter protein
MLFTLGLCLSLLAYALAGWTRLDSLTVLGGYLGLVTAVIGIYIAAAEMINETHGHVVLPLGESARDRRPGLS